MFEINLSKNSLACRLPFCICLIGSVVMSMTAQAGIIRGKVGEVQHNAIAKTLSVDIDLEFENTATGQLDDEIIGGNLEAIFLSAAAFRVNNLPFLEFSRLSFAEGANFTGWASRTFMDSDPFDPIAAQINLSYLTPQPPHAPPTTPYVITDSPVRLGTLTFDYNGLANFNKIDFLFQGHSDPLASTAVGVALVDPRTGDPLPVFFEPEFNERSFTLNDIVVPIPEPNSFACFSLLAFVLLRRSR